MQVSTFRQQTKLHTLSCRCSSMFPRPLQPHVRGFDDEWFFFDGQPGETFSLLSTGDGAQLNATLGAGGLRGQATFVRAIQFQQGAANVAAVVYEQAGQWRMLGECPSGIGGREVRGLSTAAPVVGSALHLAPHPSRAPAGWSSWADECLGLLSWCACSPAGLPLNANPACLP